MSEEPSRPVPAELPDSIRRRAEMIDRQIVARGLDTPRILRALQAVPREYFVPAAHQTEAYTDQALPVGPGQTISQPYIVAYMTTALDPQPGHRVLEIGTGTGYQAAILAHLAERVDTVERDAALAELAGCRLAALGLHNVHGHVGDGSLGWPSAAPYQRILVTAGCPRVPPALVEQLAEGGVLVLPVGEQDYQTLLRVEKHAGRTNSTKLIACRFVKLVGAQGWPLDASQAGPLTGNQG